MTIDSQDKQSNCCAASIYGEDICSVCKEHCISIEEEENLDAQLKNRLTLG